MPRYLFRFIFLVLAAALSTSSAQPLVLQDRNGEPLRATGVGATFLPNLDTTKVPENAKLTIDRRLQQKTEEILREFPESCAVIIDPRNGDILALAAAPWADGEPHPAIRASAPGATFLPVAALAAIRAGLREKSFDCGGGVTFENKLMKCWKYPGSHGRLTLPQALEFSCGSYFRLAASEAGIDRLVETGQLLHLGEKTGLPLTDEQAGVLPSPQWLRERESREIWSDGYTANTAIGQGFVAATPIQMAVVAAAIGNGGTVLIPRLLLGEGRAVQTGTNLSDYGVDAAALAVIREGMVATVEQTTGRQAHLKDVLVAGRTGTTQMWRGNKPLAASWIIGFAPANDPTVAFCIRVEGLDRPAPAASIVAGKILAFLFKQNP